eukprot:2290738-Rhodomonas_salina.2
MTAPVATLDMAIVTRGEIGSEPTAGAACCTEAWRTTLVSPPSELASDAGITNVTFDRVTPLNV